MFCGCEFGHIDAGREGDRNLLLEWFAIFFEFESERSAKDDGIWANTGNNRMEAGSDATRNFYPVGLACDFGGELTVVFGYGFGRGKIFPLEELAAVFVFVMSGFVNANGRVDFIVSDDAAANTGRESEIDGETVKALGFGESGEIGVVLEVDGYVIELIQIGTKIEIDPREVAEPKDLIAFNWPGNGNGDAF